MARQSGCSERIVVRCHVYDDRVSEMSGRNGEVGSAPGKESIYLRCRLKTDEASDKTIDRGIISGGSDGSEYAPSSPKEARRRVYDGSKASHHYGQIWAIDPPA